MYLLVIFSSKPFMHIKYKIGLRTEYYSIFPKVISNLNIIPVRCYVLFPIGQPLYYQCCLHYFLHDCVLTWISVVLCQLIMFLKPIFVLLMKSVFYVPICITIHRPIWLRDNREYILRETWLGDMPRSRGVWTINAITRLEFYTKQKPAG